jgi:hypothetical protein
VHISHLLLFNAVIEITAIRCFQEQMVICLKVSVFQKEILDALVEKMVVMLKNSVSAFQALQWFPLKKILFKMASRLKSSNCSVPKIAP